MKRRCTIGVLATFLFLLVFAPRPAWALFFWGTKATAMGTAAVGLADSVQAMEINPAGISQRKTFSIESAYERKEYIILSRPQWHPDIVTEDDQTDDDIFGGEFFVEDEEETVGPDDKQIFDILQVAIVDSKTLPMFAMGLYFTGYNFPTAAIKENKWYHFGLAMSSSLADIVYLGANVKYMQYDINSGMVNADFGALVRGGPFIRVGLAGHNVFASDINSYINRDLTLGLAGLILDYAQIDFDITKDFESEADNTWNFALGVQGIVFKGLTLRSGFLWDQINNANLWSAGIGWSDKMGELAYGFQGDVNELKNFSHAINLTIRF